MPDGSERELWKHWRHEWVCIKPKKQKKQKWAHSNPQGGGNAPKICLSIANKHQKKK